MYWMSKSTYFWVCIRRVGFGTNCQSSSHSNNPPHFISFTVISYHIGEECTLRGQWPSGDLWRTLFIMLCFRTHWFCSHTLLRTDELRQTNDQRLLVAPPWKRSSCVFHWLSAFNKRLKVILCVLQRLEPQWVSVKEPQWTGSRDGGYLLLLVREREKERADRDGWM